MTENETAQPMAAETPVHEQINDAAAAIRSMRTLTQDRDPETGKFTGQGDEPPVEPEPVEGEDYEVNDEAEEYEEDGSDEDQPESVEMPKSWSKDDEATWHQLPPAAQAKIAEREGQRDAALNAKFQEVANDRKAYEAKLQEANQSRDKWAQDYDLLVADLSLPKPDPRHYGLGTGNYNREAFDMAVLEWEQGSGQLEALKQQREEIRAQQQREEMEGWTARKAAIDAEHGPKLVSLVPELTDPAKAEPAMRELVNYAIAQGLQPDTFSEDNQPYITAAQLKLLAKAKKYDELSSGSRKPAPKQQPAIRPGVATPRSAQRGVAKQKAFERLKTENSIEAAVAAMRAARR